jgi:hypothetical protein
MKSGGGKQKGSSFEREICKKLSLWVSYGKSDDLFWRSAMSGGRATVRTRKGQKTSSGHGDITAVTPEGNILTDTFIVECKYYKDLEWSAFIYGKGFIWSTWNKLVEDCNNFSRDPFLILKQNTKPVIVAFRQPTISRLKEFYSIYPHIETRVLGLYFLNSILEFTNIHGLIKTQKKI